MEEKILNCALVGNYLKVSTKKYWWNIDYIIDE